MRLCYNCNRNMPENKRFCPYCGHDEDRWEMTFRRLFCADCGFRLNKRQECPRCTSLIEHKDEFRLKNAEFIEKMSKQPVGGLMEFGSYCHGTDETKTPISWRVMSSRNGEAMLVSEYGIDVKPYALSELCHTWENSSIRRWLNTDFLNSAFDSWEQSRLLGRSLYNGSNPTYVNVTDNGKLTRDYVALLSASDVVVYRNEFNLRCEAKYGYSNLYYTQDGYCNWWLRTPGDAHNKAIYVNTDGVVSYEGTQHNASLFVRPVIWLSLEEDSVL